MEIIFGTKSICLKKSWQGNETALHRTAGAVSGLSLSVQYAERLRAVRGGRVMVLSGTADRADGAHAGAARLYSTYSRTIARSIP
jgi:hypothetical protein